MLKFLDGNFYYKKRHVQVEVLILSSGPWQQNKVENQM